MARARSGRAIVGGTSELSSRERHVLSRRPTFLKDKNMNVWACNLLCGQRMDRRNVLTLHGGCARRAIDFSTTDSSVSHEGSMLCAYAMMTSALQPTPRRRNLFSPPQRIYVAVVLAWHDMSRLLQTCSRSRKIHV